MSMPTFEHGSAVVNPVIWRRRCPSCRWAIVWWYWIDSYYRCDECGIEWCSVPDEGAEVRP